MTHDYSFTIGNLVLPIRIRRLKASRRITLRYHANTNSIALNIPRYVSIGQGLSFVGEKRAWIASRIGEQPIHTPFSDGNTIFVLGREYVLKHAGGRGVVSLFPPPLLGEGRVGGDFTQSHTSIDSSHPKLLPQGGKGLVTVPGEREFMPRRVRDFLKQLAREEIEKLVAIKIPLLGKNPRKISLRDTHSRWGSCSQDGNLSFSWRIIMAPRDVLEYLVCHEMAHLLHMNHSKLFWNTVSHLCPNYKIPQVWLKTHGAKLHSYG